jgi:hypothetical protein
VKKIVNGKRYDTETATKIHGWENGYYPSDFQYCHEVLYQTKSGTFFLWGEGGAMSKYSRPAGNNVTSGGQDITPLSKDEAKKWLEEHDGVEALETYFKDEIADA